MSVTEQWDKVVSDKIGDLVTKAELEPKSAEFYDAAMRPEAFVQKLIDAEQWADAVKVMSRALSPRKAVYWACECSRQMDSLTSDESELVALSAAEKWISKPSDENRREAFRLSGEASGQSAGFLSALSVGVCDGRMPAPESGFITVGDTTFSQTVQAAVMVSACEKSGVKLIERFKSFIDRGKQIAKEKVVPERDG